MRVVVRFPAWGEVARPVLEHRGLVAGLMLASLTIGLSDSFVLSSVVPTHLRSNVATDLPLALEALQWILLGLLMTRLPLIPACTAFIVLHVGALALPALVPGRIVVSVSTYLLSLSQPFWQIATWRLFVEAFPRSYLFMLNAMVTLAFRYAFFVHPAFSDVSERYDWRAVLMAMAVLSASWLVPWMLLTRQRQGTRGGAIATVRRDYRACALALIGVACATQPLVLNQLFTAALAQQDVIQLSLIADAPRLAAVVSIAIGWLLSFQADRRGVASAAVIGVLAGTLALGVCYGALYMTRTMSVVWFTGAYAGTFVLGAVAASLLQALTGTPRASLVAAIAGLAEVLALRAFEGFGWFGWMPTPGLPPGPLVLCVVAICLLGSGAVVVASRRLTRSADLV